VSQKFHTLFTSKYLGAAITENHAIKINAKTVKVWVKLRPFILTTGDRRLVCRKYAFVRPFHTVNKKPKENSLPQTATQLRSASPKPTRVGLLSAT
jgi:hypothetical protein